MTKRSPLEVGDQMPNDAVRVNRRGPHARGMHGEETIEPRIRAAHASESIGPSIGAVMKDGTVHAGISPDTGKKMFALPADASLTTTFNKAQEYAHDANAWHSNGHDDWRVPTKNELIVLFNNRAAIGGFNVRGSVPSGWYWSSSPIDRWGAWGQRFSDGYQGNNDKGTHSSVRLVRSP